METTLRQEQIETLVTAAGEARERAYAPYSHFSVGAALLGQDDQIYIGCNVENESFGLTICAERVAVADAIVHGCQSFIALAVVAQSDNEPITPCGACRQVLAEFNPHLTVICANGKGQIRILKLNELLPYRFELGARG